MNYEIIFKGRVESNWTVYDIRAGEVVSEHPTRKQAEEAKQRYIAADAQERGIYR